MGYLKSRVAWCWAGGVILSTVIGVLWWQSHKESRILHNERQASAMLKTLATAEADFRANDRDGNRVQDFWVADVTGLFRHGGLIEREVAEADAAPEKGLVKEPVPYHGYYFIALKNYHGLSGELLEYRSDTDDSGRRVHNNSRFGFCAYPVEFGVTGNVTFIINEGNTIFKAEQPGPIIKYPSDDELVGTVSG